MSKTINSEKSLIKHNQEYVRGNWFRMPLSVVGSNAWLALSHTAHKLFGIMCAEHLKQWKGVAVGFDLSYDRIEAKGIDRDAIGPAQRELEAVGFISIIRKGYGGPCAKARAESHYQLAFFGDGPHTFEEVRTVKSRSGKLTNRWNRL